MLRRISPISILAIVVLSAAAIYLTVTLASSSSATAIYVGPTSQQLAEALIRAGLQPDALTAAGVSTNSVTTVVNNVKTYLTDSPGGLESADTAIGTNRPVVDGLERLIRSGQGTEQSVAALASARTLLNAAITSRDNELDAIFDAGTFNLSAGQKALLAKTRVNRFWDVSLDFTVADRSQAQWVALREALANERISAKDGEEPDAAAQALLAEARSDSAVAAAAANLEVNLIAVNAAWDAAVNP